MPDVELARRDGVEIVRTGSWPAMTGNWNPTREDIASAIKALECPAVRRPVLKVGHLDDRFTPAVVGDGEPAIGWVDNLRAADGGHTLVGDYMGMPAWIGQIMASAWPSRSIEGDYNYKCTLSHVHPFALKAVSLLGVTPPAIGTLKSLEDVATLYGVNVAASNLGTGEHVEVTIRAAAEVHTGAMIALIPTAEDAERLAVEGGEPVEQIHLTLAYLGKVADLGARGKQDVIDQVSTVANGLPRLEASVFAAAVFNPDDADRDPCLTYLLSGDVIDAVHDLIDQTLPLVDAPIPSQHRPFHAHITAAYTGDLSRLTELTTRMGPVTFDRLRLAFGGEFIDIPLMEWPGEEPDVAASAAVLDNIRGRIARLTSRVTAGAGNGAALMSLAQKIRDAWNASGAPFTQWVQEVRANAAVVVDDADRSHRLVPVTFDGDRVVFGTPQVYDPESDRPVVFASRAESRPEAPVAPPETPETPTVSPTPDIPAPILPAAEPEPENPEPKEEDPVSTTDLSPIGSRLGLNGDVNMDSILETIDALKTKADTPPAPVEPTPEMVAASVAAEAEKDELTKTVEKLGEQLASISTELAAAKADKALSVKASVIQAAAEQGKFTPAERPQWEADYDEAPGVTTRILASIAPGTAVPVSASGMTGDAEPPVVDDFGVSEGALNDWAKSIGIDAKELSH